MIKVRLVVIIPDQWRQAPRKKLAVYVCARVCSSLRVCNVQAAGGEWEACAKAGLQSLALSVAHYVPLKTPQLLIGLISPNNTRDSLPKPPAPPRPPQETLTHHAGPT